VSDEDALVPANESSDDDDYQVSNVPNAWIGPGAAVASDSSRPLVIDQIACPPGVPQMSNAPTGLEVID
jgi:hypothetical protein